MASSAINPLSGENYNTIFPLWSIMWIQFGVGMMLLFLTYYCIFVVIDRSRPLQSKHALQSKQIVSNKKKNFIAVIVLAISSIICVYSFDYPFFIHIILYLGLLYIVWFFFSTDTSKLNIIIDHHVNQSKIVKQEQEEEQEEEEVQEDKKEEEEEEEEEDEEEDQEITENETNHVKMWLEKEVNLPQYINNFMNAECDDMISVIALTDNDLLNMGIGKKGHRKKILSCIEEHLLQVNNDINNIETEEGAQIDEPYEF